MIRLIQHIITRSTEDKPRASVIVAYDIDGKVVEVFGERDKDLKTPPRMQGKPVLLSHHIPREDYNNLVAHAERKGWLSSEVTS